MLCKKCGLHYAFIGSDLCTICFNKKHKQWKAARVSIELTYRNTMGYTPCIFEKEGWSLQAGLMVVALIGVLNSSVLNDKPKAQNEKASNYISEYWIKRLT